jgi:hypothetical protein
MAGRLRVLRPGFYVMPDSTGAIKLTDVIDVGASV